MSLNSLSYFKPACSLWLCLSLVACVANNPVAPSTNNSHQAEVADAEIHQVDTPLAEQQKAFVAAAAKPLSAQKKGQWEKAITRWQKLRAEFPRFEAVPLNQAICFLKLDNIEKAEQALDEVLAMNADNVDALIEKAYVLRRKGDLTNAQTVYQQALVLAPNNPRLNFNLGVLYDLYLNQPQQALRFYQQFLDLSAAGGENDARIAKVKQWLVAIQRRLAQREPENEA